MSYWHLLAIDYMVQTESINILGYNSVFVIQSG